MNSVRLVGRNPGRAEGTTRLQR